MEIDLARTNPDRYYLVIDTISGTVELKAGGRPLLTTAILKTALSSKHVGATQVSHSATVSPGSLIPAFGGLRLGGRRLPLNFVERLIEGPTTRDRIVFSNNLVLTSRADIAPPGYSCIVLPPTDVKSLSAAIDRETPAILICPLDEGATR